MYPFLTLEDQTEIVHSELLENNEVKVCVEKPDDIDFFHSFTCYLPDYRLEEIIGFSQEEIDSYLEIIKSMESLIIEFSQTGGVDNASGF